MKISELYPEKVFYYFEQISTIPHGSGNTKALAEYCMNFAEEHQLRACQDKAGNVFIYADGTQGYEKSEPVILQGHMDMVCDKTADCPLDMDKDGLILQTDGKFLWADGTTLGGDDGIAVAYILALLSSKDIARPPIEAFLTADEETTMVGAEEFDAGCLSAKRLINLDSEEEGVMTVSCAGGVGAQCKISVSFYETEGIELESYAISVSDLLGGHSGGEIHKPRANAVLLLASVLKYAKERWPFMLVDFKGGAKENAIPKSAEALLCVPKELAEEFEESVIDLTEQIAIELGDTEPELGFEIAQILPLAYCMDEKSTDNVLDFLTSVPNGVASMSQEIEGLVQTSSNLGIAKTDESEFCASFLIRSNVTEEKEEMKKRIKNCADIYGGTTLFETDYPAWEYAAESKLRDKMADIYEKMYGRKMKVEAVHAGLECGFFAGKMPGIDMVSIGPNVEDVHTPDEKMDVESAGRCWEYLLEVLKELR